MSVRWNVYLGLFLITLATLMYELLLTRIFSATMWYHFAFMAISVAVFGMTAGALTVYLKPKLFTVERTQMHLAQSALLFGCAIVGCLWLQTQVRVLPHISWIGLATLCLTYVITTIPFYFGGVAVCLALTRYPQAVSKLYAFDLLGAAAGCLLLSSFLTTLGGPTAVIAVGAFAALGGLVFSFGLHKKIVVVSAIVSLLLLVLVPLNLQFKLINLTWFKGLAESNTRYEKWNSFSRIRVSNFTDHPFGWGLSARLPAHLRNEQLRVDIDSAAATFISRFDGNTDKLSFLKYDITNVVHYIKPAATELVIGIGGGRDLLSALVFDQKKVLGVELNDNTISLLKSVFADYSGNLSNHPKIQMVNEEARSYITRQTDKFDIIQISLIDTWAATSSGAFVLSENSLYTAESWKLFLDRLTPTGILSCCRYYFKERPAEMYRLVSLAVSTLKDRGVTSPQSHLLLIVSNNQGALPQIGTLLTSPSSFSKEQVETMNKVAAEMDYRVLLSPQVCTDPNLAQLVGTDSLEFARNYNLNIEAPTDDKPFFFQMARFKDWYQTNLFYQDPASMYNNTAVSTLAVLLVTVLVLTSSCILLPLWMTRKNFNVKASTPFLSFFCAIGFAFMFIEVSQIQRLSVFLGHPSYGLVVVLFTLLLTGGLGSLSTDWLLKDNDPKHAVMLVAILPLVLLAVGLLIPVISSSLSAAPTAMRIAAAVLMLAPAGFLMGMPFPIGMRLSAFRFEKLTPWFWGLNGATSTLASVMAIIIAMNWGISSTYYTGVVCYVAAWVSLLVAWRSAGKLDSDLPSSKLNGAES